MNTPSDVVKANFVSPPSAWCWVRDGSYHRIQTYELKYASNDTFCLTYNASKDYIDLIPCRSKASQRWWSTDSVPANGNLVMSVYNPQDCLGASISRNPATIRLCTGDDAQEWFP